MSTIRKRETSDGREYYEILVKIGREQPQRSKRWYPPDGWSAKRIERELNKTAAAFEQDVREGKVQSRAEKKAAAEAARREEMQHPTLKSYCLGVYMPTKAVICAGTTMQGMEQLLRLHVYPALGEVRMRDITSANLAAVILEHQKRYAHTSTLALYSRLNDLFKTAYLDGTIDANPMDRVQRPRARKAEVAKKPCEAALTVEQVSILQKGLEAAPARLRAAVALMLDTGIRCGELCGLEWKHIDWSTGAVRIEQTAVVIKREVSITATKTGRVRTVYAGPEALAALKAWRAEQAARRVCSFVMSDGINHAAALARRRGGMEAFIEFKRAELNGEPVTDTSAAPASPVRICVQVKALGKKLGLDGLHPHVLRHTYASLAIQNGADILSVSRNLGHASPNTTLSIYSHASAESERRSAEILHEAIANARNA